MQASGTRKRNFRSRGIEGGMVHPANNRPIISSMSTLAILALIVATIVAMEGVAWASHKYIMHGLGWAWHRNHLEQHDHELEKNDLFAIVGPSMGIPMFILGSPTNMGASGWEPGTGIGLGIPHP